MLAGGMIAIDNLLGRKPRQDVPEIREASGEPGDIDRQGITVQLDGHTAVHSPAPAAREGQRMFVVKRRKRQGS